MKATNVNGKRKGSIMLYALSTCGWCKKAKDLLDQLGVEYSYVDVDLVDGPDVDEVLREVDRWNPRRTFPTIVIDGKCIIGFSGEQIKESLKDAG